MKRPAPTFEIRCARRQGDGNECGRTFRARTLFVAQQAFNGHTCRQVKRDAPVAQLDLLGGDR